MPNILSHGKVIDDHWILLSDEDAIPAQGDIIVPLSTWAAQREVLLAREGAVSVLLDGQDEVETIEQRRRRHDLPARIVAERLRQPEVHHELGRRLQRPQHLPGDAHHGQRTEQLQLERPRI